MNDSPIRLQMNILGESKRLAELVKKRDRKIRQQKKKIEELERQITNLKKSIKILGFRI